VRSNLSLCLRGSALMWYTNYLNDIEKAELRSDLNLWYEIFKKRFQENPAVALKKLNELRYTRQDVRNRISVENYISKALRHI